LADITCLKEGRAVAEFPKGKRYFFLSEIGEPEDNTLRLVVIEASAQGIEVKVPGTGLTGQPILPEPTAKPLELTWTSYIAYAVRNESYATPEEGQQPPTDMLSERQGTAFLTFVAQATFATVDFPGPFRHWELVCLNHVVDVVSTEAPVVRQL
jgi:hypothetical protein